MSTGGMTSTSAADVGRGSAKAAGWIGKMDDGEAHAEASGLLGAPPRVINIGLELFAENLASQGAQVVHVRWSPPAGGNSQLADLLAKLRR
jgi:FdrA protein